MPMARLTQAVSVIMLLGGCANSELNAEVSRMPPIRQMDEFFGSPRGSPHEPPPQLIYNGPPSALQPDASSGYAPAYPPYSPQG